MLSVDVDDATWRVSLDGSLGTLVWLLTQLCYRLGGDSTAEAQIILKTSGPSGFPRGREA